MFVKILNYFLFFFIAPIILTNYYFNLNANIIFIFFLIENFEKNWWKRTSFCKHKIYTTIAAKLWNFDDFLMQMVLFFFFIYLILIYNVIYNIFEYFWPFRIFIYLLRRFAFVTDCDRYCQ